MGLGQVQAVGAWHFPEKCNRIQPKNPHPAIKIESDNPHHFQQQFRIGKVQVDLIMTECAPDVFFACRCLDLAQQRAGSWAYHLAQVSCRVRHDKVVAARRFITLKLFKPFTASRTVIDDEIRHEPIFAGDRLDILPLTKGFIHLAVVQYRETVIRTVGKEGQNMDTGDDIMEVPIKEGLQGVQRLLIVTHH